MRTHRSRLVIAVGLIGAFCVVTTIAQTPVSPAQPTFRSTADVVTIQASVRDARGQVLRGLTSTDFEIRDNGQLRPILSIRSDRESPLSVAILVDMSGSMQIGAKMAMARQAFDSILTQLRDGRDEAAVFTFDSSLHERAGFTTDLSAVKSALFDFQAFGATSLYDATAETARRFAQSRSAHRAIVVFTDGVDTSSNLTASEVSGLASSIDVPVYIMATVPEVDRPVLDAAQRLSSSAADLRDLAEWSGGRLAYVTTFTESVVVATNIVNELREQYVLAIEAAPDREWRRLDVRVKNPSVMVKARSGYFGG